MPAFPPAFWKLFFGVREDKNKILQVLDAGGAGGISVYDFCIRNGCSFHGISDVYDNDTQHEFLTSVTNFTISQV